MKKIAFILGTFLASFCYGQQLPQFTQYMFNQYAYNPAYAGVKPSWEAVTNNRYQWIGITDAPRTFTLSAQGPFKKENMAIGGYVYTDIVGPTRRIGFQASYAYHIQLSETIFMSFGLSLGFNQWILDADKVTAYHPNDFYFSNGLLKSFDPDGKFGLYVYHPNWYFGASVGQMLHNRVSFLETQVGSETFMEDHFFFHGGYTFNLSDDWQIEPTALLKMGLPAPLKFDINARVIYKKSVWLGGGWRSNDAFTTMVGFKYKEMLSLGYGFDITSTDLKNYSSGTHELMMTVTFGKSKTGNFDKPSLE